MRWSGTTRKAMNIAGGVVSLDWADALAASPQFSTWQDQCPYWVSEDDICALVATVHLEEEDNFILVPRLRGNLRRLLRTATTTGDR
jgi:hypothetical protein